MSVNGRLEFRRTVFWNTQRGTVAPLDILLGVTASKFSPGVREMCCRESLNCAFVPASKNLQRTAQLSISSFAIRSIVESQGQHILTQQASGQVRPDFTADDCTDKTVITGTDGVMVPLVTEEQKRKRREAEKRKRLKQGRKSTARRGRPRRGSDGAYKEFKVVAFYSKDKKQQYAVGTSGNHEKLGRIMRREAARIKLTQAEVKYSVADGASWILKQYNKQLPMLDENILDYYHLQEHVTETSHRLFGEGTAESVAWREEMVGVVWEQGSLVMLDRLGELLRTLRSPAKRRALKSLRKYVGSRVDMTDYPSFRAAGYDTGSGPTESVCGRLTKRLKGSGMRWDKCNAESMMALASIYYSGQWDTYWKDLRKAA
ncbi:MAG: hypothetical protein K8R02_04015 [Anaerohalosphaeraceae bacterium]|nr:hypothetical protein [Anaerohalosphaeraceae bacterium]